MATINEVDNILQESGSSLGWARRQAFLCLSPDRGVTTGEERLLVVGDSIASQEMCLLCIG